MKKYLLLILMASIVNISYAARLEVTGIVKKIKIFSSNPDIYNPNDKGLLMIYMDELPVACETPEKRVVITSDHPLFESVLSTALVSKTTQKPIELSYINTCSQKSNAWDFAIIELL